MNRFEVSISIYVILQKLKCIMTETLVTCRYVLSVDTDFNLPLVSQSVKGMINLQSFLYQK